MKRSGASLVVEALEAEGIELAFGIPGTHNIELYDELAVAKGVRTILVTDEQSASFAADGVWRASGRMACVNVVPGAGLTHALSGIAEAFLDQVPMLVLGCGIRGDTGRAYQLHDIDQAALVAPVVKACFRPQAGSEIVSTLRRACRLARAGAPGPVFVEIPADLYLFPHEVGRARSDAGASDGGGSPPGPLAPAADLIERCVERLVAARRPLLYVGAGAGGGGRELVTLAERLEMPVSSTFQGKGVFPESHPLFLWPGFGEAAPAFVRRVVRDCDATLAIGCRFSEVGTGSYGLEPPAPLLHVDIDPAVHGRNYPADVAVVADATAFLRALLEALETAAPGSGVGPGPDDALRAAIRRGREAVRTEALEPGGGRGEGVTPGAFFGALQSVFGPDAIYSTDSGNGTFLALEHLRLDGPGRFLAPVDYSCMGYAVPAAIGAALALPERSVVALAGDGAFLMTGLELITAAREGVGVVAAVLRDRELAQIAQLQAKAMNRKVASRVGDYELEHLARGTGCDYLRLLTDADCEIVLGEARERARKAMPVVVEVAIDYSRPTHFTRGVVRANLNRLPLKDRLRFVGRALTRRVTG